MQSSTIRYVYIIKTQTSDRNEANFSAFMNHNEGYILGKNIRICKLSTIMHKRQTSSQKQNHENQRTWPERSFTRNTLKARGWDVVEWYSVKIDRARIFTKNSIMELEKISYVHRFWNFFEICYSSRSLKSALSSIKNKQARSQIQYNNISVWTILERQTRLSSFTVRTKICSLWLSQGRDSSLALSYYIIRVVRYKIGQIVLSSKFCRTFFPLVNLYYRVMICVLELKTLIIRRRWPQIIIDNNCFGLAVKEILVVMRWCQLLSIQLNSAKIEDESLFSLWNVPKVFRGSITVKVPNLTNL